MSKEYIDLNSLIHFYVMHSQEEEVPEYLNPETRLWFGIIEKMQEFEYEYSLESEGGNNICQFTKDKEFTNEEYSHSSENVAEAVAGAAIKQWWCFVQNTMKMYFKEES